MILIEAVRDLESLDEEATIYAEKPWRARSETLVAREPEEGGGPAEAHDRGMSYFIEVSVARDFLDGWAGNLSAQPTPEEKCERLIHYAVFDA